MKVAKPIIEIEEGENVKIDNKNKEGEFKFIVKNYNSQGNITGVKMKYKIEILANDDSAISYALFEGNKQIPMNGKITNEIKIGNQRKETHIYNLKITYEESKNTKATDLKQEIGYKIYAEETR